MIAGHDTATHVERLARHYRNVKRSESLKRDNQFHANSGTEHVYQANPTNLRCT
jgi:hypothetical protein